MKNINNSTNENIKLLNYLKNFIIFLQQNQLNTFTKKNVVILFYFIYYFVLKLTNIYSKIEGNNTNKNIINQLILYIKVYEKILINNYDYEILLVPILKKNIKILCCCYFYILFSFIINKNTSIDNLIKNQFINIINLNNIFTNINSYKLKRLEQSKQYSDYIYQIMDKNNNKKIKYTLTLYNLNNKGFNMNKSLFYNIMIIYQEFIKNIPVNINNIIINNFDVNINISNSQNKKQKKKTTKK